MKFIIACFLVTFVLIVSEVSAMPVEDSVCKDAAIDVKCDGELSYYLGPLRKFINEVCLVTCNGKLVRHVPREFTSLEVEGSDESMPDNEEDDAGEYGHGGPIMRAL